jgi:hypothetical protein
MYFAPPSARREFLTSLHAEAHNKRAVWRFNHFSGHVSNVFPYKLLSVGVHCDIHADVETSFRTCLPNAHLLIPRKYLHVQHLL